MNFNFNTLRRKNNYNEFIDNNDPYGNNYSGTHILPRPKEDEIKKRREEELEKYKEIWFKEIEERKIKKEEEKRKKAEMDILEEERIKKEIEEINKREEKERREQKEKENYVYKENEKLIKNRTNIKYQKQENGLNNMNIKVNDNVIDKDKLIQDEFFDYKESINQLKNKYKDVDLNNIHFYKKNGKYDENKKQLERKLYYNKMKKNIMNNRRSVNEFEFSPNPKLLDDSKNPQIARLKKEVNYGYMQISSYIKNLRNNVIEADKNKNKAEKELKFISNEIDKERKYQLSLDKMEYDKKKNEEYNYNNNYYTNINDVDPIYYDLFPINQSNMNDKKQQMSNLAIIGQNLIKLSSESEFIPVGMNYNNNYYKNIGITEQVLMENNNENNNEKGELENETEFQKSED